MFGIFVLCRRRRISAAEGYDALRYSWPGPQSGAGGVLPGEGSQPKTSFTREAQALGFQQAAHPNSALTHPLHRVAQLDRRSLLFGLNQNAQQSGDGQAMQPRQAAPARFVNANGWYLLPRAKAMTDASPKSRTAVRNGVKGVGVARFPTTSRRRFRRSQTACGRRRQSPRRLPPTPECG
jgi:hypothetical protein